MSEVAAKPLHTVSVRKLVEFILRRGDLGGEREFADSDRALAGIRGHQKIQRSRPTGYLTELPVEHRVEVEEFTLLTLLGGAVEDLVLQLASPFPPENLAVLIQDRIQTHFKGRAESLGDVVASIEALVQGRPGNYLVYFPSRFNEVRYRRLFPAWWKYLRVRHADGLREALGSFWRQFSAAP